MDFLRWVYSLISDKSKAVSTRAFWIIITVIILIIYNDISGFTFNLSRTSKIEQLEKISTILTDNTLNPSERARILALRTQILYRQNFFQKIETYFKSLQTSNVINERNTPVMFLTTSGIFIIAFVALTVIVIRAQRPLKEKILSELALIGICIVGGYIFFKLLTLIPKLSPNWGWNYVINIILQFVVPNLIIFPFNKDAKDKIYGRNK